jgi:MFS superfamily sulfate permease-like transporter
MNVVETFKHSGDLVYSEFLVFLVFFLVLFNLMRLLPGRPWIVPVAFCGIFYGVISSKFFPAYRPTLLSDLYPQMLEGAELVNFSYLNNDIPVGVLIEGALEVAFVTVLETLISARIADTLTCKFMLI